MKILMTKTLGRLPGEDQVRGSILEQDKADIVMAEESDGNWTVIKSRHTALTDCEVIDLRPAAPTSAYGCRAAPVG